jgi:hypothetical protein
MTQLQQLGDFLGRKFTALRNETGTKIMQLMGDMASQKLDLQQEMASRDAGLQQNISILQGTVSTNYSEVRGLIGTLEYQAIPQGDYNTLEQSKSYTDTAIANLVDSAPETMNTLAELAAAIEANETVLDAIQEVANNHTHANATQTAAGFMSAADKMALDNVGSYAQLVAAFNAVVGAESPLYESDENNPPALP